MKKGFSDQSEYSHWTLLFDDAFVPSHLNELSESGILLKLFFFTLYYGLAYFKIHVLCEQFI